MEDRQHPDRKAPARLRAPRFQILAAPVHVHVHVHVLVLANLAASRSITITITIRIPEP